MPNFRRKQAFSGKQKKQQLQSKKQNPGFGERNSHATASDNSDDEGSTSTIFMHPKAGTSAHSSTPGVQFKYFESKLAGGRNGQPGRYALKFRPESKEEIEHLKAEARKVIHFVNPEYLECKVEDFFSDGLEFPIRPQWDYNLSKDKLESQENKYFTVALATEYLQLIDTNFKTEELSYFELNLETWRQFWRVLEMSDILLCVVDIRFPALLFPPKLYDYCQKTLGKSVIIVLNKIDMIPASLVVAWKDYFKKRFPDLEILCFTSYEGRGSDVKTGTGLKGRRRFRKLRMATEGSLQLHKMIEKIVAGQVDLSSWKAKILEESNGPEMEETELEVLSVDTLVPDTSYYEFKKYHDGILTIGTIGQPNTGKSSLINGLMGKKVVSVSKTPGHTKHFQTIYLTSNVRLCDCPGLIFPSKVPKSLQVLCGSYPIAQLREPFSTIKYLGERTHLTSILKISHPEGGREWSAFDITDGWAEKKGYHTAKTSRLDSYRAANHILRLALEGRIVLALRPPNYSQNEGIWKADPEVAVIEELQDGTATFEDTANFQEDGYTDEDNNAEDGEATTERPVFSGFSFALLDEDNE